MTRRGNSEGTIGKRQDGRWWARYFAGGKRKAIYGKTREEVAKELAKAIAQRDRGQSLASPKLTVSEYLKSWLEESVLPSVSTRTYTRYNQHVNNIIPFIGAVPLQKLNPGHVEVLKNRLLVKLSHSGASQTLVCLSSALEQAMRWEMLTRNPVKAVRRPKPDIDEHSCLTEDQAARLVEHVRGTRHEALYLLALKTGMRQSELADLRWKDVNSKEVSLGAHATKTRKGRTIRLTAGLPEALERHKKITAAERLAYPGKWERGDLVFPSRTGKRADGSLILRELKQHLKEAGLPQIRFHDLRDTCATLMLRSNIPLNVVAKILGHKDPAITLRRYSHVLSDMEDDAIKRMDRWAF